MSIRFQNYRQGFRIVSLALDEMAKQNLLEDKLSLIFVDEERMVLLPDEVILSNNTADIEQVKQYNSYDVLEIWENGMLYRRYNDNSNDNYFFVTGRCNSNCVMCPSPEFSRKNAPPTNVADLIELAKHIPPDSPHLTITGGEPFLIGEKIFPFIQVLKERFSRTEFLFLTNGRVFAVDKYVQLFKSTIPYNAIVAIPVHGSSDRVHDSITRANGSFRQTKRGIKQLLKNGIRVEIRLVVSKLNIDDFENIADLIISEFKGVDYVSVIAMEMTGNARVNKDQVWIPYKESFSAIADAVQKMVKNGFDVKLYNFPICTVDKPFWTLCEKSISSNKVRFAETCEACRYKSACSGVFAGTFQLEKDELRAII